jgi:hypothetical protein
LTKVGFIHLRPKRFNELDSSWRRITLYPGNYLFAYSAFYDDRISPHVVRLNVAAPLRYVRSHGRTRCLIETSDGEIRSTSGQLEVFNLALKA